MQLYTVQYANSATVADKSRHLAFPMNKFKIKIYVYTKGEESNVRYGDKSEKKDTSLDIRYWEVFVHMGRVTSKFEKGF